LSTPAENSEATWKKATKCNKHFLRGWLSVLGLKEGLVECATVCVKSMVILKNSVSLEVGIETDLLPDFENFLCTKIRKTHLFSWSPMPLET
jgi:hypothetical protein